jgi:hypothetical protein
MVARGARRELPSSHHGPGAFDLGFHLRDDCPLGRAALVSI